MKEAFEKIKERVCEFIHERNKSGSAPCKNQRASCFQLIIVCDLTAIVNQVAEEYGKDTNVRSDDGWIPCSERLPETDGSYLVCSKNGNVYRERYYCDYSFRVLNNGTGWGHYKQAGAIIAWQPLPAPYKPKGEA